MLPVWKLQKFEFYHPQMTKCEKGGLVWICSLSNKFVSMSIIPYYLWYL